MGLKESGLRGSLRNVSVGIDAIPDTLGNRWSASEQEVSDGESVDPFADSVGEFDLTAVASPTLAVDSVNGSTAVALDGSNDGYDYGSSIPSTVNEPATLLFSMRINELPDSNHQLWRDTGNSGANEIIIRPGVDAYRLTIDGSDSESGSPTTGDFVFTVAIDDTEAVLRVNGTDTVTTSSSADVGFLNQTSVASLFYNASDNSRYLNTDVVEIALHPDDRLTGADLEDEEKRLEDEANMNVLS